MRKLPRSTIKRDGVTLHANAAFRTKENAKGHAEFKRKHGQYARVVKRINHGSQGGWWVYVAYKPGGK